MRQTRYRVFLPGYPDRDGALCTCTDFARRGIGNLLVHGILDRDFPMVQAIVLILATIYVLVNLAVDLSYGLLDPRIRYG